MSNTNKPTPHPHAELIVAWAKGETIQVKSNDGKWVDCPRPSWSDVATYRIKPEEPSNEPWKPKKDEIYFFVSQRADGSFGVGEYHWSGNAEDNNLFGNNNCFRTREEAKAAVELVKDALKIQQRVIGTLDNLEKIAKDFPPIDIVNKGKLVERVESMMKDELKKTAPNGENFQLDGKPLTDGEKELIKALRLADIRSVIPFENIAIYTNEHGELCNDEATIAFTVWSSDELIRAALEQIQAEQEARND